MELYGIGTATYYDPGSGKIATLGHGIVDIDTESLITVESGTITKARTSRIKKGVEGIFNHSVDSIRQNGILMVGKERFL